MSSTECHHRNVVNRTSSTACRRRMIVNGISSAQCQGFLMMPHVTHRTSEHWDSFIHEQFVAVDIAFQSTKTASHTFMFQILCYCEWRPSTTIFSYQTDRLQHTTFSEEWPFNFFRESKKDQKNWAMGVQNVIFNYRWMKQSEFWGDQVRAWITPVSDAVVEFWGCDAS